MISVIVLTCGTSHITMHCLQSIVKTVYKEYEVIVVDNASVLPLVGGLVGVSYPSWVPTAVKHNMHVVCNQKNSMYAGGMNIGIKESKGDVIICLPNDTVVHPDWLAHIHIAMMDETIGAAVPMLLQYRSNKIETAIPKLTKFGFNYCKGLGEVNNGQYDKEVPDYISGACFITRRSVIDKVGMFDERMSMWWQDIDLSLRIRKAGYRLELIEDAKVWHMGGQTVKDWNWMRRKYRMQVDRMWGMYKWMRGEYR